MHELSLAGALQSLRMLVTAMPAMERCPPLLGGASTVPGQRERRRCSGTRWQCRAEPVVLPGLGRDRELLVVPRAPQRCSTAVGAACLVLGLLAQSRSIPSFITWIHSRGCEQAVKRNAV